MTDRGMMKATDVLPSANEQVLRQMLADLQREYHARAKPIMDALLQIEAMKPPAPVIVSADGLWLEQVAEPAAAEIGKAMK